MFKIVPDDVVLANGQGKTRAGKYGEMRLPARWRLVFLSTGEVTLESHLASIGKRVKAGQQVRVIDLRADAGAQMGVFNQNHGMNAADLADHLKQQGRQHYGSLALDRLRHLTQHGAQVRPDFQNVRQRFLTSLPPEADGQVLYPDLTMTVALGGQRGRDNGYFKQFEQGTALWYHLPQSTFLQKFKQHIAEEIRYLALASTSDTQSSTKQIDKLWPVNESLCYYATLLLKIKRVRSQVLLICIIYLSSVNHYHCKR